MFRRAEDIPYTRFLRRLHDAVLVDWYLEVGCRTGRVFAPCRSKTIAVDPYFLVETNVIGAKPAMMAFQQTSDDFFASGVLERLGVKLSFSFLDGMHLFEFLLRDFFNAERRSAPGGVIVMHDCCPYGAEMTTRDLDDLPRGDWTGDVWKLIPILAELRPDLQVDVVGCAPTGLVIVSGLDPANTALADGYDDILANWMDVGIEDYGVDRFYGAFDYVDARGLIRDGFPQFAKVALSSEAALAPEYVTP